MVIYQCVQAEIAMLGTSPTQGLWTLKCEIDALLLYDIRI